MKFLADEELLLEKIEEYFLMGISDTKMTKLLCDDFGWSDGIRYGKRCTMISATYVPIQHEIDPTQATEAWVEKFSTIESNI